MYKFNDKGLARYRYKQKQNPWNLLAVLVCSTQSPNLVSNSSYFPQAVGLCEAPGSDVPVKLWTCVREILKVPIFVGVLFILSIRNLDLQIVVCCIKQKEILK